MIFDERGETEEPEAAVHHGSSARLSEVEAELELSERRFQSIIEEYESSQEEMRASQEELQSANEELRSTLE